VIVEVIRVEEVAEDEQGPHILVVEISDAGGRRVVGRVSVEDSEEGRRDALVQLDDLLKVPTVSAPISWLSGAGLAEFQESASAGR
jgi:hypothetical protein